MKGRNLFCLLALLSAFALSGCVVRTYSLTKDRVDQDLTIGNRGYLQGEASVSTAERKPTRTTQVIEVELRSPFRFEKASKPQPIETTERQELIESQTFTAPSATSEFGQIPCMVTTEKYTVQKNDTLQKISKKFYGTTKKWAKIYEANKDTLKGPDKIYPGKTLNIPIESSVPVQETTENLK